MSQKLKKAVFLFGLPCSGKTTWYFEQLKNNRFENHKYISADKLKETYEGYDETVVSMFSDRAIKHAKELVLAAADNGQDFLMDAGGINNRYTMNLMKYVKGKGYTIRLVNIDTPYEICLDRNKKRARSVPPRIIIDKAYKRHYVLHRLLNSGLIDIHESYSYYTNKHLFFDMDGVLAAQLGLPKVEGQIDFVNAKYFPVLPPVKPVVDKLNKLATKPDTSIYILSSSPTSINNDEKIQWLQNHVPIIKKENIFFVGSTKYKSEMYRDLSKKLKIQLKDMCMIEDNHMVISQIQDLNSNAMHVSEFLTHKF